MTDTHARFLKVFTDHFGVIETPEADPLDAILERDFVFDSLDPIELSMLLEEEFGVELSDDEVANFATDATLRQILELIEGKLAGKVAA